MPEPDAIPILLVDDNPANLLALEAILASPGYRLIPAGSGEEALQRVVEEDIAVILLDVAMPGMDGFEVARRLKELPSASSVPIIFLTAVATDPRYIYQAYKSGAVDYLIKPLDVEMVRRKVAVFTDMFRQRVRIERQALALLATERREFALRLAEVRVANDQRYRKLVEGIDHVIAWSAHPGTGRLTFISRQAEKLLSCTAEHFLREGFWGDHLPDEDRPAFLNVIERAVASGVDQACNHRLLTCDGRALWFHTGVSVEAASGSSELHGISVDVTELKESEATQRLLAQVGAALSESIESGETLSRLVPLLIPRLADWCIAVELDAGASAADGPRISRIVTNHRDATKEALLAKFAGHFSPSEVPRGVAAAAVRSGISEVVASLPNPEWLAEALGIPDVEAARELGATSCMFLPLAVRGSVLAVLLLVVAAPRRHYGKEDLALAEEVAARAALAIDNARLYRKATEATRAREELLAIVSHDLRSPLSAISVTAAGLSRQVGRASEPDVLVERAGRAARNIAQSSARMKRLIEDLLDTARLQAGKLEIRREPVDVDALVDENLAMFAPLAEEKRVSLTADVPPGLEVLCDRHRVLQVLSNLIGNAIKFTPPGGHVELRVTGTASAPVFSVSDTGAGIPREDVARVFERFWQAGDSRQGFGLGLPIAKAVVEAHGGRLWVESAEGSGTTFNFTLFPERRDSRDAEPSLSA